MAAPGFSRLLLPAPGCSVVVFVIKKKIGVKKRSPKRDRPLRHFIDSIAVCARGPLPDPRIRARESARNKSTSGCFTDVVCRAAARPRKRAPGTVQAYHERPPTWRFHLTCYTRQAHTSGWATAMLAWTQVLSAHGIAIGMMKCMCSDTTPPCARCTADEDSQMRTPRCKLPEEDSRLRPVRCGLPDSEFQMM